MSKIKAIISDSDGTLVNTLYLIRHGQYEAAVEYLTARGISHNQIPPYEVYEDFINKSVGGPTKDTFHRTLTLLFQEEHKVDLTDIDFDELDSSLRPIQDRIAPLYVHPFHGLTELFSWLGEQKISLGIFTSGEPHMIVRNFGVSVPLLGYEELYKDIDSGDNEKLEAFITRIKAVFNIPNIAISTCHDVAAFKPDPEGILSLMDQLNVKPDEVIALGDHPVDIHAAKAAGIHAIGITHGFGSPAELKAAGAIDTTNSLHEVIKAIKDHNNGKQRLF
jgi:phosphoglycolate phosphatase-like HAD superfamily hydrolase